MVLPYRTVFKSADRLTYSKEPGQTVRGLCCLIRPVNTKTLDKIMVQVSATGRCTLHGISTCILLLFSSRSNNKRIFRLKVTSVFSNNFKIFVLDSLIGYFHIV